MQAHTCFWGADWPSSIHPISGSVPCRTMPSIGDTLRLACLSLKVGGWGTPKCLTVLQKASHQGAWLSEVPRLQEGYFQSWQWGESPERQHLACCVSGLPLWSVLVLENSSCPLICWLWYTLLDFSPCVPEITDVQLDVFFVSISPKIYFFLLLFKGLWAALGVTYLKQVETNHAELASQNPTYFPVDMLSLRREYREYGESLRCWCEIPERVSVLQLTLLFPFVFYVYHCSGHRSWLCWAESKYKTRISSGPQDLVPGMWSLAEGGNGG